MSINRRNESIENENSSDTAPTVNNIHNTENPEEVNPILPPLYFASSTIGCSDFPIPELPTEMISVIVSYLDWGDNARLAPVSKIFQNLLVDSATHGGEKAMWTLASSMLHGKRGMATNPSSAVRHLENLVRLETNIDIDEEELDKNNGNDHDYFDGHTHNKSQVHGTHVGPAIRRLATCHFTGIGVPKRNVSTGLNYLSAAFHVCSDISAAYEAATVHENGLYGADIDIVAAASFFLKAAEAGHLESMAEYAMCCELGCGGMERNDEDALYWYTKAAEGGHSVSSFSVGEFFEEARAGLAQSDTEAVRWYYRAAKMGDADSRKALLRLKDIASIILPGWAAILHG